MTKQDIVQLLVDKKILISTDLKTPFNLNLTRDTYVHSVKEIVETIIEVYNQAVDDCFESVEVHYGFDPNVIDHKTILKNKI